jgi:hypothetical protein
MRADSVGVGDSLGIARVDDAIETGGLEASFG